MDHSAITSAATVVVLYVQSVLEAVRRILRPLNIRTCIRPDRKDAIDPEKKAAVVHRISNNCPVLYVDQTRRSLTHCAQEHCRVCQNGDMELSPVAEHAWSSGHAVE